MKFIWTAEELSGIEKVKDSIDEITTVDELFSWRHSPGASRISIETERLITLFLAGRHFSENLFFEILIDMPNRGVNETRISLHLENGKYRVRLFYLYYDHFDYWDFPHSDSDKDDKALKDAHSRFDQLKRVGILSSDGDPDGVIRNYLKEFLPPCFEWWKKKKGETIRESDFILELAQTVKIIIG